MAACGTLFNFEQVSASTYRFLRVTRSQPSNTHVERFNAIAADECVTVRR
jgi:hypothetical protein